MFNECSTIDKIPKGEIENRERVGEEGGAREGEGEGKREWLESAWSGEGYGECGGARDKWTGA